MIDLTPQGLAKGTSIPMIGSVQVTWFTGTLPSTSSASKSETAGPVSPEQSTKGQSIDTEPESLPEPVEEVEDVVARGWGREDDGMGM